MISAAPGVVTRTLIKKFGSLEAAQASLEKRELVENRRRVARPTNASDVRLATGKSLGSVVFKTIVNNQVHRLRCTSDCVGGRGLRVFDRVAKGVILARGSGIIVRIDEAPGSTTSGQFKIYDTKDSYLLLDPPSTAMPASLANTSDGIVPNNCRITHKAGSDYFSIVTLRALEPGEEVLVAYGSKFTGTVREVAKEEHRMRTMENKMSCNMLVRCVLCNSLIKNRLFKYHSKLVCRRKQKVLLS